jgi:tetratricopeptide (TPR) repeat protein
MKASTMRSHSPGALAALIIITATAPAIAQGEPVEEKAAEPTEEAAAAPTEEAAAPSDETGDDADADAAEPEPAPPKVDPYAEAKERVGRAEQLFEDGNYDAALTEFERAYETMLGHPARNYVLFNVGKCQEKLYRYDAAVSSYKKYLEDSDEDAEDRATVAAKIELLEGLLGSLEVTVSATEGPAPASYEVWVDGRLIGNNSKKFSIPGGSHQVEIRAEGFEVQNQEVQLPARSSKALSFNLAPLAKEYKGLPSTYFWTASGLAAAAGIAGGAFGVMAITERSSIDNKEPELVTANDEDSIKNKALMADLFFAGAGVCATTAVILAFMTDWSDKSAEKSPVQVKEVGFAPTRQGAFLNVRGSF